MTDCPDDANLADLVAGRLAPERAADLERHLEDCPACRRRLDDVAGVGELFPAGPPPQWHPPSDALRRVVDGLRAAPAGLPFLTPTDRPGFLGRLGAYEIRREIGRGGMGVVFEGLDPALKRTVAVKVLSPLAAADDAARDRFRREAQAAAALAHEHVVAVHAVDEAGGVPFLVMQFVAGESLADRLDRDGRLAFADVVRVGAQVARGLAAAHAHGLVHRDIKPANILLEGGSGRAKIADFGLAKAAGDASVSVAGTVAGTPEFMSPEQAVGGTVDTRSDLFSLGAVLHAACTGQSPFRADSPLVALDRVRRHEPESLSRIDPTVPEWFGTVVERLLRKDPSERIASAAEVADILERSQAAPTVAFRPSPPRRRRGRWVALAVGVLALAGVGVWYANRAPQGEGRPGPARPLAGFVVGGTTHATLAEAVAAAADEGVVEVHGDGPFPTAPVRVRGKRLTIRAAAGSRPVFAPDDSGPLPAESLIDTDSDLQLEDLTIRWETTLRSWPTEANIRDHSAVASSRGRLALVRCRVELPRVNYAVGTTGRELVLTNCHLVAAEGFGVFWRPEPGGRLTVEGCQIETRAAVTLYTAAVGPGPAATLHLADNTVVGDEVLRLLLDARRKQPLKVTAERNVFAADTVVVLQASANLKKVDPPRPEVPGEFLRSFVTWADDANLYRRGCDYIAARQTAKGPLRSVGLGRVADWLAVWNLPPAASAEGVVRFRDRPGTPPAGPLRLDPAGGRVGADPDHIGPK